jgi:hypothetical protein
MLQLKFTSFQIISILTSPTVWNSHCLKQTQILVANCPWTMSEGGSPVTPHLLQLARKEKAAISVVLVYY